MKENLFALCAPLRLEGAETGPGVSNADSSHLRKVLEALRRWALLYNAPEILGQNPSLTVENRTHGLPLDDASQCMLTSARMSLHAKRVRPLSYHR